MRTLKIFGMGLIGLIAVFAVQIYFAYTLIAIALIPLALLIVGQFYLPHSRRAVSVWFDPAVFEHSAHGAVLPLRLSGKELKYTYFKQSHEFKIVTHRFWLLGIIGVLSLSAAAFASRVDDKEYFFHALRFMYLTGLIWLPVIFCAYAWLRERRMLRLEGLTIGPFSVYKSSQKHFSAVRYYFVDPNGEYRGGTMDSLLPAFPEDMTIVFYDPQDPERNIAAAGLNFHKLVWKEDVEATERANSQSV